MTNPSVTETTIWRAASELAAGDRIAPGFLPDGEPAEILFTTAYRLSANRDPFVLVVFRADDGDPDDYHFRADSRIPLERAADLSGMGYSREDTDADDPTPVSPARVPLHTGGVTDCGLVDETEAAAGPECAQHWPGTPMVHMGMVAGDAVCGRAVQSGERMSLLWKYVTCKACVDAGGTPAGPVDRRTCVDPGDQEHDHEMCKDVVAEDAERAAEPAYVPKFGEPGYPGCPGCGKTVAQHAPGCTEDAD